MPRSCVINSIDMPGYFLNDYALAADVVAEVDAPNIGLQFDSYHAQMIHGDSVRVFETYRPLIRHIQIGDAPDRGVPGSGEVDFAALFAAIREVAVQGHALVDQELEVGLCSIAVPVRDRAGQVVAALNVSSQAARLPAEALRATVLPRLQEAARSIAAFFG